MTSMPRYLPLGQLLGARAWPSQLLSEDGSTVLDRILVSELAFDQDGGANKLRSRVLIAAEASVTIPGLPWLSFALAPTPGGTDLPVEISFDPFKVEFRDLIVVARVSKDILQPMSSPTEPDLAKQTTDIQLGKVTFTVGELGVGLSLTPGISLPLCMIGTSGVLVEGGTIGWLVPGDPTPPGASDPPPPGFTGLFVDAAAVHLPDIDFLPSSVRFDDCYIGTGGFTGHVTATAALAWDETAGEFTGPITGRLFGFPCGLAEISVAFVQSSLQRGGLAGDIYVPYLEKRIGVALELSMTGDASLTVGPPRSSNPDPDVELDDGLLNLHVEGVLDAELDSVTLDKRGSIVALRMSGSITPDVADLDWPTFRVKELAIDSEGNVQLSGGWLDLPKQYSLDLFGFRLEITKIGFGRAADGGRWIGFSGAIKLVDALPAGASVEGLRITWYDDGRPPALSFNGVGVEFEIPDVLRFKGEVALRELPGGVQRFDGAIDLDLICLDTSVSAQLVVGTAPGYTFFAIYVDAELPAGIPLFATGLGLYGFAGLFALNMEPNKTDEEQWYSIDHANSWYHRNNKVGVTDLKDKWRPRGGSVALGAGVTLGTLSDNGYAFSGKLLLAIVFPGPILLVEGAANLLKERAKLGTEEPTLRTLAVLDGRAGSFTFGVDARYRYGKKAELLDIRGSAELYVSLANPSAWHLYIGRRTPTEQRIRAEIFRIFSANAYLELGGQEGLATGAWIGLSKSWTFGPASVTIEAWIEGGAELSFKPTQLAAYLWLHGKVEARAFGIGIGLSVDARLAAEVFTPFLITGEFEVTIEIPIFPDISLRVPVQWGPEPIPPPVPLPLKEIAVEHFKATTSWPLPSDGPQPLLLPRYDVAAAEGFLAVENQVVLDQLAAAQALAPPPLGAPVVPLDGRPHLTFSRAVNDPALVGTTGQAVIKPEWERIGDPSSGQGTAEVRYSVAQVELHRHGGGAWSQVAQTPASGSERLWGSWATVPALPDGGDAPPAQTKLWLWSKNPFDYTRRTGGALDDWATGRFPGLPCPPPPGEYEIAIDFEGLPLGRYLGPTGPAELAAVPFLALTVEAVTGAPPFTRALSSPGLEVLLDLYYRRGMPGPALLQCKALSLRLLPGDGQQRAARTCSTFTDRAIGTRVGVEHGIWFYRLEGQLLGTSVVEWRHGTEVRSALDCTGQLVMALLNPAHRVEFTLWTASDAPPQVEAQTQLGDPYSVAVADDPADPRIKYVTVTGTSINTVSVPGGPGIAALAEVCCDREYALHLVADDGGTMVGPFPLGGDRATATGKDLRRARVNAVGPYRALQVTATVYDAERTRIYEEGVLHMQEELARWSQPDFALEPYGDYRLAVTTRMEVKPDAGATRSFATRQFAYFRTEGPPGLADLSLPLGAAAPEELTLRDADGDLVGVRGTPAARPVLKSALNDMTPYVRQTLPATVAPAGEKPWLPRPVFRAYDVGVEFNENSYVEAMYRRARRDLALYVSDASDQPVRDASGALVSGADHWTQAEQLTLTESERRWAETVDRSGCLQLDRSTIQHDLVVHSRAPESALAPDALHEVRLVPLLLHEDFSGGTVGWTVRDDGVEGAPSAWAGGSSGSPPAPFLRQTSSIRGGSGDPSDPVKPGTVLLRADDPRLGTGHPDQTGAWGDVRVSVYLRVQAQGWTGVIVRDRGPADAVRVALGPAHWTLVRIAAGAHTLLASGEHALPAGGDHLVAVEAVGAALRVHLDGAPLAAVTDVAAGGRVGLYCWNAPGARFADLRVDDCRPEAPVLHRFRFVTSRFASFEHQVHSFRDAVWQRRTAAAPGPLPEAVALPGRSGPSPAEVRAFETLAPSEPAVDALDVTRIDALTGPVGFLLHSPEPLDWSRLDLEALRAPPWPRPYSPPGDVKLTGVTFAGAAPNDETVTLLLRSPTDLGGVVIEQRGWAPAPAQGWSFVDEGDHEGPSAWTVSPGGDLAQTSAIFGPDELGTCALTGRPDGTDARLTVTLRSDAGGAIGAVLRYRDPGNCYCFSMRRSAAGGYRRLVRRVDGATRVLWEDAVAYVPGRPYSLALTMDGQTLTGELDGQRLFAVEDPTHEAGRLGLYCAENAGAHFEGPVVAEPDWIVYHAFGADPRPLPAGTRVRLYAGTASAPHDADTGVVRRFLGAGIRLPAEGAVLRVRGGHCRRFLPAGAYAPVELRILRNADGTGCFLARPGGVALEAGEYRLRWTYHRDNRAVDAASPVLSQGGATTPERPVIDLPWRALAAAGPAGLHPSGFSDHRSLASARRTGTEILILKRASGPLALHIDARRSGLPPTDVWVLAPSGDELWHATRIDLELAAAPDGAYARLDHSIETTETGVFHVLFGARELFLRQRLTDDLPEALLVKPGAAYLWGDARGAFLDPRDEPAELAFSAWAGWARLVDAERVYRDLGTSRVGVTVSGLRELELQAADGAAARFVASGTLLFGAPADLAMLAGLVPEHVGFAAEVMADRPLAYYRFGEPPGARTVLDTSGHGNHGAVLSGGVVFGDRGAGAGPAARFVAAEAPRIRVADRDALSPAHVSIEALVVWSGPTGDVQQRILEKAFNAAGDVAGYGLSLLSTGAVRVELMTEEGSTLVTSAATLVPGEPAHLAATYGGAAVALYVNGELDTLVTRGAGDLLPTVGVTDLGIGNQLEPGSDRAFDGAMDELALYDHALPHERIRAHAAAVDAQLGNLLRNSDLGRARPVPPPPLTGAGVGGPAAAEDWSVWNNPDATTTTARLPTTRPDGTGGMLHVATTAGHCGLVQTWASTDAGPAAAVATAWVYVVHGRVGLGSGNGGGTSLDVESTTTGQWELLEASSGGSPVNELIVYSGPGGAAEFYVDFAGVRPLPDAEFVGQAVPETAAPGERLEISVTLRNRGPGTWTREAGFGLGPLGDSAWDLAPIDLEEPAAPGAEAVFGFEVAAPAAPGDYALQWRMRVDDEWFGATTPIVTVQCREPQ